MSPVARHPADAGEAPGGDEAAAPPPGRSASDVVFSGILARLEARRLVPGQRLVEAELAAGFGVSRNSVREALQRLAAEGIVDLFRHRARPSGCCRCRTRSTCWRWPSACRGFSRARRPAASCPAGDGGALGEAVKRAAQAAAASDPEAFARRDATTTAACWRWAAAASCKGCFPPSRCDRLCPVPADRAAAAAAARLPRDRPRGAARRRGSRGPGGDGALRSVRDEILRQGRL